MPPLVRELGKRRAGLAKHLLGRGQRHEVGLREVAVVVRVLLGAKWGEGTGARVEVEGLLSNLITGFDNRALPLELRLDPSLQEAEAVHVLQLGLRSELLVARAANRDVRVTAQAPLLHVHVGDTE